MSFSYESSLLLSNAAVMQSDRSQHASILHLMHKATAQKGTTDFCTECSNCWRQAKSVVVWSDVASVFREAVNKWIENIGECVRCAGRYLHVLVQRTLWSDRGRA